LYIVYIFCCLLPFMVNKDYQTSKPIDILLITILPILLWVNNKAIVDSIFRPLCATHHEYLVLILEQNLAEIDAAIFGCLYAIRSPLRNTHDPPQTCTIHDVIHKTGSIYRIATPTEEDPATTIGRLLCTQTFAKIAWFLRYACGQSQKNI